MNFHELKHLTLEDIAKLEHRDKTMALGFLSQKNKKEIAAFHKALSNKDLPLIKEIMATDNSLVINEKTLNNISYLFIPFSISDFPYLEFVLEEYQWSKEDKKNHIKIFLFQFIKAAINSKDDKFMNMIKDKFSPQLQEYMTEQKIDNFVIYRSKKDEFAFLLKYCELEFTKDDIIHAITTKNVDFLKAYIQSDKTSHLFNDLYKKEYLKAALVEHPTIELFETLFSVLKFDMNLENYLGISSLSPSEQRIAYNKPEVFNYILTKFEWGIVFLDMFTPTIIDFDDQAIWDVLLQNIALKPLETIGKFLIILDNIEIPEVDSDNTFYNFSTEKRFKEHFDKLKTFYNIHKNTEHLALPKKKQNKI